MPSFTECLHPIQWKGAFLHWCLLHRIPFPKKRSKKSRVHRSPDFWSNFSEEEPMVATQTSKKMPQSAVRLEISTSRQLLGSSGATWVAQPLRQSCRATVALSLRSVALRFPGFGGASQENYATPPQRALCQKGLRGLLSSMWMPSRPSPGSDPGPVQFLSRVQRGPVQIGHCFLNSVSDPSRSRGGAHPRPSWSHPGPCVPSRIGPGRAETDFLATSDCGTYLFSVWRGLPVGRCRGTWVCVCVCLWQLHCRLSR